MASAPNSPSDSQFTHYAQALSATVFSDKKYLTGQQLLAAVPERQVNLLVLYRLKERWEEEASSIRSPFFDYEAAPVRDAQRKFLNTLSQHIRLSRATYEGLLAQALKDAWQLAGRPAMFIAGLTEKMARPGLTVDQVQTLTKYLVYHGDLLRQALRDLGLTGRTNFLKGDLYQQLQQLEDRLPAGGRGQFLHDYNAFLVAAGQAALPTPELEPAQAEIEPEPIFAPELDLPVESTDAFMHAEPTVEEVWPVAFEEQVPSADALLVEEPLPMQSSISAPYEPEAASDLQDSNSYFPSKVVSETRAEQEIEKMPTHPPEPSLEFDAVVYGEEPEAEIAPEPAKPPVSFEPPISATLGFQTDKEESLGDRLGRQQQGQSVYGKVSAAGSENLHSLIAIGDRYMMVAQLFAGDMASYSLTVSHINGLTSFDEAVHYLWDEIGSRLGWNPESDAYKTLDAALRRKFAV